MASAAAVLFVQNDADDIGWWIAYHIALGFDASSLSTIIRPMAPGKSFTAPQDSTRLKFNAPQLMKAVVLLSVAQRPSVRPLRPVARVSTGLFVSKVTNMSISSMRTPLAPISNALQTPMPLHCTGPFSVQTITSSPVLGAHCCLYASRAA